MAAQLRAMIQIILYRYLVATGICRQINLDDFLPGFIKSACINYKGIVVEPGDPPLFNMTARQNVNTAAMIPIMKTL